MTRNRFFYYIVILSFALSLAGCGSKNASATSTPASSEKTGISTEEFKPFDGEGEVQGGIKSDDEITALQEEEAQYAEESTTEYAENVDNTGHEPESYGSGNFQDYWQGDDYFDLEGYLHDIGCNDYYGFVVSDGSSVKAKEGEMPIGYLAYYKEWQIGISPMTSCYVVYYSSTGDYVSYTIHADTALESHFVTVNSQGTTTTEGVLQTLCSIVNAIDNDPTGNNPFQSLDCREY